MMAGLKIRALLNGGELAVVETRGLRRVMLNSGGLVGELYTIREAKAVTDVLPGTAKAVSYPALAKHQTGKAKPRKAAAKPKPQRKTTAA